MGKFGKVTLVHKESVVDRKSLGLPESNKGCSFAFTIGLHSPILYHGTNYADGSKNAKPNSYGADACGS